MKRGEPRAAVRERCRRTRHRLRDVVELQVDEHIVAIACEADGAWFYCRVDDRLPDGDLVCSVVDAQWWPSLMIDGIIPGVRYAVRPDRVLSVIRSSSALND